MHSWIGRRDRQASMKLSVFISMESQVSAPTYWLWSMDCSGDW